MVTFLIGLVVGIAVGSIPFHLSGGIQVKKGAAGGAFLVSLILKHCRSSDAKGTGIGRTALKHDNLAVSLP